MQSNILLRIAEIKEDLEMVFSIRNEVFVMELQVPPELEIDCYDKEALHIMAFIDNKPVGTARLVRIDEKTARIGRVAVIKEARKSGIGRRMVNSLTNIARNKGYYEIILDALTSLVTYYNKMGYEDIGEPQFEDAGYMHTRMRKILKYN